jgi:NADH:ubiquinone oxidoreductase subunit 5 (subunit L)/multisubunit Na+/H+ antiporter MnhA subunit
MLTFAYCLRFITLTFLGKKSEHLEKLHIHEAPKIMLAPAVVLAALCAVWGFVGPWFGSFMGADVEISVPGAFLSSETVIFLSIIMPVGLIMYLTYFRNSSIMQKIRGDSNPLSPLLKHGYFFDDLYERIAGIGIVGLSSGTRRVEVSFFQRFPQLVASSIISIARAVQRYLEVMTDQLLSLIAHRTLRSASQMKKVPSTSLQHYLAAALLGFILILILIIVTIGV